MADFVLFEKKSGEIYDAAAGNTEQAKAMFCDLEDATIDDIVNRFRPRVKKVAAQAIIGNLPGIPFANPFGLYLGSRDTINEFKKERQFNWFYLLRDMREKFKKSDSG